MKRLARILLLALLLPSQVALAAYAKPGEVVICTSVASLNGIVADVVGENVRIISIVPPGAEPHVFQLSPSMINELAKVDLFVFTGHFEFEGKIIEALPGKKYITLDKSRMLYGGYEVRILEVPGGGHNLHAYWIHPKNALAIARAIVDELVKIDPSNAGVYKSRLGEFENKVDDILRKYAELSERYKVGKVVIAFLPEQYFVDPLGPSEVEVLVRSEYVAPSGRELQGLISSLRGDVKLIISSDVAKALYGDLISEVAREVGAKVVYLDIVAQTFGSYVNMMYYNLGVLKASLEGVEGAQLKSESELNVLYYVTVAFLLAALAVQSIYMLKTRRAIYA